MERYKKIKEDYTKILDSNKPKFFKGYHFIFKLKTSPINKLFLVVLMDDANINHGIIQWTQKTYADKLGIARSHVNKKFNEFTKQGVLVPLPHNKPASQYNKYVLDLQLILNIWKVKS
jgi:AraC-like DNA-binding protein